MTNDNDNTKDVEGLKDRLRDNHESHSVDKKGVEIIKVALDKGGETRGSIVRNPKRERRYWEVLTA